MSHGLIILRMICKARPFEKRTGMINTYTVPIAHVSGSHQLGRIFLEMIIITTLGNRLAEMCTAHVKCMVYVEIHCISVCM